jgi:hypothetical protein
MESSLIGADGEPASPLINWLDRRLLDVKSGTQTWLEEIRGRSGQ